MLTTCYRQADASGPPFLMAYRGASADHPEHSLGAYRAAFAQGARFIECDVVLTKDLVPICRHEPNIAETTDVLARRTHQPPRRAGEDEPLAVLASDLTLPEIKALRAIEPGTAASRAADASVAEDDRVATLAELLQLASAAEPAMGVALHLQSCAWHNQLPAVRQANTSFEDILLSAMQSYGYARGPYGSEEWRQRPTFMMAFEAGSLKYLAQRTDAPLTQVLGPTIPDTGETWDSATSEEGLARIRAYAGSVAVARQQLLTRPAQQAGAGAAGLVAAEVLGRMRRAGLQVLVSVFKPARVHLLPGVQSWEEEVAPLLLGTGLEGPADAAGEGAGEAEAQGGEARAVDAGVDGLFTDSPAAMARVMRALRCSYRAASKAARAGRDEL
ncbi:hypothetical protein HYH03_003384 [Edaphochlamys debaryana]|uniref:glycerophosphodiester phosphodiesterase n=1 Tax=Edaphochlamys debaryana TaxID=47281 RepID=A0A835YBS9_9CHLO|nr:hypothetical protein HYH03_003384 [Edaphochlamys debaryana]|eukprot:KAG2498637.1 hypothetical protein HYH03_003384 [Edaphochlamys debaryana]